VLTAEVEGRGLVRRDNAFSSRHKGVSWDKMQQKWLARVYHGGKTEHLGYFATEEEAKACYDARCLELGVDPDAGTSSGFRGVTWFKAERKWKARIMVDGKCKTLGSFAATARGEVGAALAFDAAARVAGRAEKANFEPTGAEVAAARPGRSPPGAKSQAKAATDELPAGLETAEVERRIDDGAAALLLAVGRRSSATAVVPPPRADQRADIGLLCGGQSDGRASDTIATKTQTIKMEQPPALATHDLVGADEGVAARGQRPAPASSTAPAPSSGTRAAPGADQEDNGMVMADPGALAAEVRSRGLVRLASGGEAIFMRSLYVYCGESLRKYTGWCKADFTAAG
jgi:hypothetical protein